MPAKIKNSNLTATNDGKSGHRISEYKFRNLQQKLKNQNAHVARQNSKKCEIAFTVYKENVENNEASKNHMVWLIDFGESDHMVHNRNAFNNLTEIENQLLILT